MNMVLALALCVWSGDTGLTVEQTETLRREGASDGLIAELDCVCKFLDDMRAIRRQRNKDIYDGLPQDPRTHWPLHDHDSARAPGVAFQKLEMLAPHSDVDSFTDAAPAPPEVTDATADWEAQNALLERIIHAQLTCAAFLLLSLLLLGILVVKNR